MGYASTILCCCLEHGTGMDQGKARAVTPYPRPEPPPPAGRQQTSVQGGGGQKFNWRHLTDINASLLFVFFFLFFTPEMWKSTKGNYWECSKSTALSLESLEGVRTRPGTSIRHAICWHTRAHIVAGCCRMQAPPPTRYHQKLPDAFLWPMQAMFWLSRAPRMVMPHLQHTFTMS